MQENQVQRLRSLIAEKLDVPEASIADSTSLADLGADSLDVVDLVMSVEDEFKLKVPDEDYTKFATFGDAVEYISVHLG